MTSFSGNAPVANNNYGIATGTNSNSSLITLFMTRDPTVNDFQYQVKQRWLNVDSSREWILTGFTTISSVTSANWIQISGADSIVSIDVPNGQSPVSPDANGLLNFTNTGQIEITGTNGGLGAQQINFAVSAISQIGGLSGTSPIAPDANGLVNFTSNAGTVTVTGSAGGVGNQDVNFDLATQYVSQFGLPNPTTPILPDANGLVNYTSTNNSINITGSAGGLGAQNINLAVTQPSLTAWTPSLAGDSVPGTATYITRVGYYTLWGNMVFAHFTLVGNTTGGVGNVNITGLPYSVNALVNNVFGACVETQFNWGAGNTSIAVNMGSGSNIIKLITCGSGATFSLVPISNTNFNVQGSIFFPI